MVTVIDFQKRVNADGREYYALILNGGIELIKSKDSELFYATSRKGSLACTFNEDQCKALIGTQLPGTIEKVEVEPYEYTVPSTGEVMTLTHKFRYNPSANSTLEETVFAPIAALVNA